MKIAPLAALLIVAGFSIASGLAVGSSHEDASGYSVEIAPRECCKVCHKGKACGDTCIPRDRQCHKPPGCACNEGEL